MQEKFILGLDQNTGSTGFCVFKEKEFITSGCVVSKNTQGMYFEIKHLLDKYKPNELVIEDIYLNGYVKSFESLARLQGIIMALSYEYNIPLILINPTSWKNGVGLLSKTRNEQKQETINLVKDKYNITVNNDEADSIMITYYYLNQYEADEKAKLEKQKKKRKTKRK